MQYFDWNEEKNEQLREQRDLGFEDIVIAIHEGRILERSSHPNRKKYPNQHIYIVEINNYAYIVPFVEDNDKIFLKTIIPSRKATKKYIINK